MTRRFTANRIKSNRNYTVADVSETLGVHFKTVRNWIRVGLPVIDANRPLLINGADLKVYLKQKRRATMFDCESHEMCCFRCKEPMKPMRISVNPIGRFGFIRSLFHLLFRPCQFYLK